MHMIIKKGFVLLTLERDFNVKCDTLEIRGSLFLAQCSKKLDHDPLAFRMNAYADIVRRFAVHLQVTLKQQNQHVPQVFLITKHFEIIHSIFANIHPILQH